jgi:uncharacterized protein YqeY
MALIDTINKDLITAMKAKEAVKLRGIRLIKSALILLNTEGKAVTEEAEIQTLQKMAKQRKESLEIYTTQNRPDLAIKEQEELEIIETYLPKQMSIVDLKAYLTSLIGKLGVVSAKEMGKVMPVALKELGGTADGKAISILLKELLPQ